MSLVRWVCSIATIRSAHSICSSERRTSASRLRPAESVSSPGVSAKICSAVGLRSRFLEQRKRTRTLFFEIDAEQFVLSAHEKLPVAQGQGAPVAEIFFALGVGSEDVGFREESEAF